MAAAISLSAIHSLVPVSRAMKCSSRWEWQSYPAMTVNADFLAMLDEAVTARGLGKDAPVYFICRSGARASRVAPVLIKAGVKRLAVLDGGMLAWKAAGLPLAAAP